VSRFSSRSAFCIQSYARSITAIFRPLFQSQDIRFLCIEVPCYPKQDINQGKYGYKRQKLVMFLAFMLKHFQYEIHAINNFHP
jgi:hypothetical protein